MRLVTIKATERLIQRGMVLGGLVFLAGGLAGFEQAGIVADLPVTVTVAVAVNKALIGIALAVTGAGQRRHLHRR